MPTSSILVKAGLRYWCQLVGNSMRNRRLSYGKGKTYVYLVFVVCQVSAWLVIFTIGEQVQVSRNNTLMHRMHPTKNNFKK
ncbi:hypothetical protein Y032_0035g3081 [Ancylostoma ceylanicum]|uniref:Uncharacterized protein n=1 Tax=Ancylostoma ceylanicum TaxID=53326 RepID=A0A016UL95_9BILA|nr:hypothetical protein Y032_0035g3081 [Ancylostoma ceylanicum]